MPGTKKCHGFRRGYESQRDPPSKRTGKCDVGDDAEMPVLWSSEMKHQHQASAQDLEKRLRFLDEYKRIRDEETGATDGNEDETDGEESQDVSPSTQFFLTK
jgi:hypothetical protein